MTDKIRTDSFISAVTKIGTALDQRESYQIADRRLLTPQECRALYAHNDLAAAICDLFPDEALAPGVRLDTDKDTLDSHIESRMIELDVLGKLSEAAAFGRCYGDCFLYAVVDDSAADEAQPLDLDTVRRVRFLRQVERLRVTPMTYYMDPREENHGRPETYMVTHSRGAGTIVHESRLIPLIGARTSEQDLAVNNWFHHSVLQRVFEVLRDFGVTWSAASLLVSRSAQGKYKLKDLADLLSSPGPEAREQLSRRIELIDATRGSTTSLILDAEGEDFTYEVAPLTSLPELLDRFSHRLSAASGGIPVTKLFGTSPGGMGNTGESDQRNWDRILDRYRRTRLAPALHRIGKLLLAEKRAADADLSIVWPDLGAPSAAEEAQRRAAIITSDATLIASQVLTPEQVARARFVRPDGFDSEIVLTEEDIAIDVDLSDVAEPGEGDA